VIVGCAILGRSGYKRGEPATERGDWFMFDMGIALQNIALAAYSLGLGTVHVGLLDFKKVGKILNLPEGVEAVEMLPLGHPDQEPIAPPRKEISELVYYDRFEDKK
jgi:nitroreductase